MSKFKLSLRTRVKIRTFYRRIAVMFTSLIYISCSYTSGGTYLKKVEREPTGNQMDDASMTNDSSSSSIIGGDTSIEADITGTPSFSDSRGPSSNTSNVSPSGSADTDDANTSSTEWMADTAVCQELATQVNKLKSSPGPIAFLSRMNSIYDYLCKKDGLDIMRDRHLDKPNIDPKADHPLIAISKVGDFNKHEGSLASVQVGGASFHKNAKVSNVVEISKLYCNDFAGKYVPLYPAIVFDGVNTVTTKNHDNKGNCDYTFVGKKVLNLITPQYDGTNKVDVSSDGKIAILFNFLTKKKESSFWPTTVHENVTLTIVYADMDEERNPGAWVISVNRSQAYAPASNIYNTVNDSIIDGLSLSVPFYGKLLTGSY